MAGEEVTARGREGFIVVAVAVVAGYAGCWYGLGSAAPEKGEGRLGKGSTSLWSLTYELVVRRDERLEEAILARQHRCWQTSINSIA